jgi:hypothetical protein
MDPTRHRKQWAIVRKAPEVFPDYPHPECITGGWMALLSDAERAVAEAKAMEMRGIDGGIYNSYTGYDALSAETQASVRAKLDANKEWERTHGTIWFRPPKPLDPRLLVLPDSKDSMQKREWKGKYMVDAFRWLSHRRREAGRMVTAKAFPVRTYIART